MKKIVITISLIACLPVLLITWWSIWCPNTISIYNKSSKVITAIRVTVSEEHYKLNNISAGGEGQINFDIHTDSDFSVEVDFDNQTTLKHSFGYVTGGAGAYHNRVKIEIYDDKIVGNQKF